jgi:hypothetical protein
MDDQAAGESEERFPQVVEPLADECSSRTRAATARIGEAVFDVCPYVQAVPDRHDRRLEDLVALSSAVVRASLNVFCAPQQE